MPKLQSLCPKCGKIAQEKSHTILPSISSRLVTLLCGHTYTEKIEKQANWKEFESIYGAKHKLYPYQGAGYEFALKSGFRTLIADEPGLGKTLQAITCLKYHHDKLSPTLIIVKSALKKQWMKQLVRWLGIEFSPQIIESSKDYPIPGQEIIITTYDVLWRMQKKDADKAEEIEKALRIRLNLREWDMIPEQYQHEIPEVRNPFKEFGFKTVILDECQQIKNPLSKRAQQVRTICDGAEHVLALSGTPIKNNAGEYFTILNILRPEMFPSYKRYLIDYCDYYTSGRSTKVGGIRDIEYFKAMTSDFIIRRTRAEVLPDLPTLDRKFVECDFSSDKMKAAYEIAQKDFEKFYTDNDDKKDFSYYQNLLAKMSKLRHLSGLNKVPFAAEFIEEFLLDTDPTRKMVVFVHHQDVGQMLQGLLMKKFNDLEKEGIKIKHPSVYTSDLNSSQRQEVIDDFCNNPESRVLIGSTLAMGEGVDGLQQVCQDFIFLERQWNPANEEQAEGRFIRIGAKENISISGNFILTAGTIDEFFTEIVERKRAIMSQTLDGVQSQWDENNLMAELAEAVVKSGGKKWKL